MWEAWKSYVRYHVETGNRWCLTGDAGEEVAASSFAWEMLDGNSSHSLFFSPSLRKQVGVLLPSCLIGANSLT